MAKKRKKSTPFYLWPFVGLWRLMGFVLRLTGRLTAIMLGLVLMIGGAALTVTIVGAPVGIPFFIVGILLAARGILP